MMRFIAILTLISLSSCSQITGLIPITVDQQLGEQVSLQVQQSPETEILDSVRYREVYNYVEGIRDQILQSDEIKYAREFPYDVTLIKDDSVLNAFALPGGHIYVYTGLIKFLNSEAQLAGVIGHEIAHAEQRHSVEQMAGRLGLGLILSLVFSADYSVLLDLGAQLLTLNFSRSDEAEADEYAVRYLYDTPYDPRGVAGFFQKMIDEGKDADIPAFLSTHPASGDRVEDIMKTWEKLGKQEGISGEEKHQKIVQILNN